MKKFQFHMEKLLSYKGQLLDSEKMNLAVLNNLLRDAQERLESLEREQSRSKAEFESRMKEQITPVDCQVYASYESYIKEQIHICKMEIYEISEQIEKQVERVKNLKVETKSLETIKESRFVEYQKEGLKKSELLLDEFVSTARVMSEVF
ncbi:MAG: FliJ family protein [Clostridiales bacterium]|nr:FliJ family protein [Clostridiales bacterium]